MCSDSDEKFLIKIFLFFEKVVSSHLFTKVTIKNTMAAKKKVAKKAVKKAAKKAAPKKKAAAKKRA